jgi:hypothetical protein
MAQLFSLGHLDAMKITRFTSFIFLGALLWVVGCASPKPVPDPLAGWIELVRAGEEPNQAITTDYQSYIRSLPPKEREYPTAAHFYTDGNGQHAVRFEVNMNGVSWAHVLIYDKDNERIRVIKYLYAYYRS